MPSFVSPGRTRRAPRHVSINRTEQAVLVRVHDELDMCSAAKVRVGLGQALLLALREGPPCLEIDLGAVPFADSTGLAVLAGLASAARSCRVQVRLTGVRPSVRRVLDLTGLAALFPPAVAVTPVPSRRAATGHP
ncbi:STAS domain-containing protein [Carbonactinospora thermoautotrophica]|uniref:STAS domain-containing protein n=1 Tax=Carbonactinospora thermoautotrophica TaxID=1469144 RepID=UPI000A43E92B|nr:STAS domain-containing protein [Carbonactinospora thermoautotrophica]